MLLIKKKETPSGWNGRNSPRIMIVNEFFSIYDSSLFMSYLWSVPYALLEALNGKLPRISEQWTLHLLSDSLWKQYVREMYKVGHCDPGL